MNAPGNENYKSLKSKASAKLTEKRSVFICNVSPAATENDALEFIDSLKKRYSDATHNIYAYILRENNSTRFSDAGEPRGTAGLPVLGVLRKENITDAVAVVTRYFGGTLLGTGGLARAYSASAALAVKKAGVVLWVKGIAFDLHMSYGDYDRVSRIFGKHKIRVLDANYAENVEARCFIEEGGYASAVSEISNQTSGRALFLGQFVCHKPISNP